MFMEGINKIDLDIAETRMFVEFVGRFPLTSEDFSDVTVNLEGEGVEDYKQAINAHIMRCRDCYALATRLNQLHGDITQGLICLSLIQSCMDPQPRP